MTVLFKRLTVFRFLTVPPSAVHGLPKYDGISPSTGTDVQHGKITSGIFPYLRNFPEDYPGKMQRNLQRNTDDLGLRSAVIHNE